VLQRLIGVTVGALVTFGILFFWHADATQWAIAAAVGAIASFFWPIVIGFWLGRRAKERRNDAIEAEVARQVAQQTHQD
jgi:hypothetical protein